MHVVNTRPFVVGSAVGTADPTRGSAIPRRFMVSVALLECLLFPPTVSADLLGVISNSMEFGAAFTSTSNDPLYFAFGNFTLRESSGNDLFLLTNAVYDSYAFTRLDISNVFYLTAAEDADFTQLAANLVNGESNRIGWVMAFTPIYPTYSGTQNYEDYILAGSPYLTNGIDLQGTVIDCISLVINDLCLDSPGSDPNDQGNWTDFRFSVTLAIEGHVIPEPSTVVLLLLGSLGCAWGWVHRRRT